MNKELLQNDSEGTNLTDAREELKRLKDERIGYLQAIKGRRPTDGEIDGAMSRERRITHLEMTPEVIPPRPIKWQRILLVNSTEDNG